MNTLKFGNGEWYGKEGTILAYNDENSNYKPLPFSFERDSSATVVNKDGLIEQVGSNMPRIDYTNDSEGALLLEPQSTNLITYSSDLSVLPKVSVGSASSPVTTANYALAPDGTMTATRVVFDLNGGTTSQDRSILRQSISSGDYYLSIYVKSTNGTEQKVMWHDGSEFNTTTVTNQWKRITYDSRSGISYVGIALTGESAVDISDILVWGFQAEANSYPTSYIPTQGSAVTRVADSCSQTPPDGVIGQTEGVFFLDVGKYESIGSISNGIIYIYNALGDRLGFAVSNTKLIRVRVNAVNEQIGSTQVENSKTAIRYTSTGIDVFYNGVKQTLTTIGSEVFSLPTSVYVNVPNQTYGIKGLQLYNTALTDQELAALTQV